MFNKQTIYNTLRIEALAPNATLVTLNRPEVSNAFNTEMAWDITNLFVFERMVGAGLVTNLIQNKPIL